ncbi:MAG: DMT family transporter, partial [Chloroflexi bacterium]|nr:DMT family transporter [Chloroflexota bacterium]
MRRRNKGIHAALLSAFFLGMAPILGKQAILSGLPPLAVVALRTLFAFLLLLGLIAAFKRSYLRIYSLGLVGCLLAGAINGTGSLFYYSALGRIDAGVGQLLYSLYPLFVAFWLWLDKQPPSKLTLVRITLAIPAVALLSLGGTHRMDLIGMGMMLVAAALYALHLPINQRVLFDVPAPTVTLYTLMAMSLVVVPAFLLIRPVQLPTTKAMLWPVVGLTLVTFFSRLTLFLGVKHIGGMQTALLGLGELLVTLAFSHWWLHESLTPLQWLGAALLGVTLLLTGLEKPTTNNKPKGGWL